MAAPTLSTSLSRRSMLAGGTAAFTASAVALAALPAAGAADPDARLLRRIAVAERRRAAYLAADELTDRLFLVTYRHPEFNRPKAYTDAAGAEFAVLAERTGHRAAAERSERCWDRYQRAMHAAFEPPAASLAGLCAKLTLGATVARAGGQRFEWLDRALADARRLAASRPPAAGPA